MLFCHGRYMGEVVGFGGHTPGCDLTVYYNSRNGGIRVCYMSESDTTFVVVPD